MGQQQEQRLSGDVLKMHTADLPVQLSAEEMLDAAKQLADHIVKIDELQGRLEEHRAGIRGEQKALKKAVSQLAFQLRSGTRSDEVQLEDRANWEDGTVETFRLDTGELIGERDMTPKERQRSLSLAQ